MKNIIGRELITDPNIAIFELVKNSYDANSSKVTIIFEKIYHDENKLESKIIIIDDGDGMTLEDIKKKWLFAGYSEKKIDEDDNLDDIEKEFQDRKKDHSRIYAGAKGIGRFSADRLGDTMIMYSKKSNDKTIHCLKIDWNNFKDQKKRFENIKADYESIKKIPLKHNLLENFKKGTIIEINPLSDKWERNNLVRLRQYLQRLINPNQISAENKFKIFVEAKEFSGEDYKRKFAKKKMEDIHSEKFLESSKEYEKNEKRAHEIVNGYVDNIVFEKLGIKTTQLSCYISEEKIKTEIYDKGSFVFEIDEENKFHPLKDITIHLFYLNREAKTAFTKTMGVRPFQYGSIFLYKNGFRIQPLGDPKDDWLDLEGRKGQGYGRNLSRREVIGRVEITGPQLGFKEVTSRDRGVVHSKEYSLLLQLMHDKVLKWLTRFVVEGIDWDKEPEKKIKTDEEVARDSVELIAKIVGQVKDPDKKIKFNPDLLNIFKKREIDKFPNLIKSVKELSSSIKSSAQRKEIEVNLAAMEKYGQKMTAGMRTIEGDLKEKDEEILFLKKSFSPDTRIIEDYHHHIGISTGNITTDLKGIIKIIQLGGNLNEILPFIDSINYENEKIKSLVGLVNKANFKLQKQNITEDLISFISQYLVTILGKSQKRLRYEFINRHLDFKYTFIPLEITMIIDNLIHNAAKADASLVKIKFEIQNKSLYMIIGDNGKGIDKKNEERLFERGFTTTKGSGIGLHNIKSTLDKMKCKISFKGNNFETFGKGACFEVIIS